MSEKDLSYRLTADSREFEKGFKSAEASARAMERELARLEAQQAKVDAAMQDVGLGLMAAGGAIAAGLVLATKAAIDWESAWTGVAKVIDGSPEQMAALEGELRMLAKTLPQTHEEIAGVAAAAGQLGVAREDITKFTRVMVDLGTATNLASEEAAFALSRMMNIMQTAPEDVDRLGAAIVDLGNNSATTEADIVEMALRIAGAGQVVGMSEADVLSFAAALSSVGVHAEAGGSAISRAFIRIDESVRGGGDSLKLFARTAGLSVDEFVSLYERDAAAAVAAFIEGLGGIQAAGGDVFKTLNDLGMSEILLRDAMLRLAGAGDLVSRSLDIGNQAWEDNTALVEEASRRYETVEARMQIARNSINDFAIDMGQTFLPVVGEAADLVTDLAGVLGDLPGPAKTVLGVLGAIAAALLLTGGTALVAVPMIAAYRGSVEVLINSQGRLAAATLAANNALSRVGSFLAGPWGLVIAGAVVAMTSFAMSQAEARGRARELSDTLDKQSGAITRDTALWVANQLASKGAIENADKVGISAADLTQAILGEAGALERVNAKLDEHKVSGNFVADAMDSQVGAATSVRMAMQELGGDLESARKLFEQLAAATDDNTLSTDQLEPSTRRLAEGLGITSSKATDLAGALDDLDKELKAVFDSVFGLSNAEDDLLDAMDRLKEGIVRQRKANEEGAGSFKGTSKAARENRDNLQEVLEKYGALTLKTIENSGSQEDAAKAAEDFKAEMAELAKQLGINIDDVDEYNEVVAEIERVVNTRLEIHDAEARAKITNYVDWLKQIPPAVRTRMIAEQHSGRGHLEFSASGGRVGSRYAFGGTVYGPYGYDAVPAMLTRDEHVSTVDSARRNRAALEAGNAGAKLAVVGSPRHGSGGSEGGIVVEQLTVQAWTDRFSLEQVRQELAMRGVA